MPAMQDILGTMAPFQLNSKTFTVTGFEWANSTQATPKVRAVYNGFGNLKQVITPVVNNPLNRLYLKDWDGNLHHVELTHWDIAVAKDHEITIVWPMGKQPDDKPKPLLRCWNRVNDKYSMGNVLAIKNHQTGQVRLNEALMRAMASYPWLVVIPVSGILIFYIIKPWLMVNAGVSGPILFAVLIATAIWRFTWNPQRYNQLKVLIESMLD
jgi:hypothetical protein